MLRGTVPRPNVDPKCSGGDDGGAGEDDGVITLVLVLVMIRVVEMKLLMKSMMGFGYRPRMSSSPTTAASFLLHERTTLVTPYGRG